ncbi:extracellular solute-binding protein [Treponema sp. OttesenSCG-928-L16]|nr:extracellular solute-binding protein [Treponema sp. OttesenSCG-928-L16]
MKRMVVSLLFVILAASLFAGGGGDKSTGTGPINLKVTYSGSGANKDLLEKGLAIFNKDTGYNAEVIFIPNTSWAEYFTKIQTMIAGGEQVDAACVAIEGFEMLVRTGMAMPVDDWISRNKEAWDEVVSDIDPMVINFMKFDGKQYGAPNEWNNVVTHFNTDLLKDAGLSLPPPNWNKDQFLEYAQKMTKKRPDGTTQYGCFVPVQYFNFESWLYNNNAAYMTDDFKKSTLLDPNTIEMFQFAQDLIYKYQVAPIPEPGMVWIDMLVKGDVAMIFAGRWPTNNYVLNNFKNATIQYVPNFKRNVTIWGGTGVFTLKTSKNPDQAAQLSLFLASKPWIETVMQYGAIPVLKSVAAEVVPALGVPQNAELYFNSAPLIKAVQSPATYAECANLIHRVLSDIFTNRQDVMTTLRAADVELNSILAN